MRDRRARTAGILAATIGYAPGVVRSSSRGWRKCCHPCSFARLRALAVASPLVVAILLLTLASDARAEDVALSVHVFVEAPGSCTSEGRFWAEVAKRTSEIRRAAPTDRDVPTLVVRAWEEDGKARGELFLRTTNDEVLSPRHVVARTCAEVTAALALAFVLALEEGELTRPPPPAPAERQHPPTPPERPMRLPVETRPGARPDGDVERPQLATSMGAHLAVASIDGVAFGGAIFSDVRPALLERRLSFRLQATALRRAVARDAGEAELSWVSLRARLCIQESIGITLALCGLVEGGAFKGAATQARNPLSYVGPWAGAGLAFGAMWLASGRWGLDVEAGVLTPFVRDDLVLQPRALLYSTPTVAMWVGIGPVLHF